MPGTPSDNLARSNALPADRRALSSSRRAFLSRCGLLGIAAGAGLGSLAIPPRAARAETSVYDYTSRQTFDAFDRIFHESSTSGQPDEDNDHGGLAWGQSYVLLGFIRMYEAYKDAHYLDRLINNVDLILDQRDSARGVTDYTGRSLPAWRTTNPYTAGVVELTDDSGRPVLEVRSARSYADTASATVRAGSAPDTFTLEVRNGRFGYVNTFPELSMDPASPNYVVKRVYDAYPTTTMTTARDLREVPGPDGLPTFGSFAFASRPVIFAVHTGMITYPIAAYVRTVYADPRLRRHPHYKAKADEYLAAVEAAAAVHDHEWRDGDGGIGYFQWPKGMPVPYDGTEQPINQSIGLGQTYAELFAVTGNPVYATRIQALARMFASHLSVDDAHAYVWPYWPAFGAMYNSYAKTGSPATDVSEFTPSYGSGGVGAQQIEDLSHAAISVEFAALAFREQLGFRGGDMAAFAHTFSRNLATEANGIATTFVRVDGGGGLAPSGQYLQAPRWMPVAQWDEQVFTHCRAIYDGHDVQPGFGSGIATIAYLNWFARRIS